mmetsp:Transcript_16842/g.19259  ORF Transcript_16842/g.19259 Transcript_16842/m.19259 type:complete len:181 (-) Transcript_16842:146-688(-)
MLVWNLITQLLSKDVFACVASVLIGLLFAYCFPSTSIPNVSKNDSEEDEGQRNNFVSSRKTDIIDDVNGNDREKKNGDDTKMKTQEQESTNQKNKTSVIHSSINKGDDANTSSSGYRDKNEINPHETINQCYTESLNIGNDNKKWRCACENGFLPPGLLQSFGGVESMMRMGTGQCYHKR